MDINSLVFLGEIEKSNAFEAKVPVGRTLRDHGWEDDFLLDDSALVYFQNSKPAVVHACHCTDLYSRINLAKVVNI